MRCLKCEAIKGDAKILQPMIDALKDPVKNIKEPGAQPVNSDISDVVINFLNDCCSYDGEEFKNDMGVFGRSTTGRRLFDSLPSLEIVWYLNNEGLDKNGWRTLINANLAQPKPKAFSIEMPAMMRFVVKGYTIVEYKGVFKVSGSPRPTDKTMYGLTFKIAMSLKYAQAEDFWTKLNPPTDDYFSGLDMDDEDSYKKEYTKVSHVPFTSLFKDGVDVILFRSVNKSFRPSTLSSLVFIANGKELLDSGVGIHGDSKKTDTWFKQTHSYTVVEVEGMVVYDGKKDVCPERPRLLNLIKDEVDSLPLADSYLSAEYDIQVFVYDEDGDLSYKQLATLKMVKNKNDYCGTIINERPLIPVSKPKKMDFERLERDNTILKEIQNEFVDSFTTKESISVDVKDPYFSDHILSFIRSTKDSLLEDPSLNRDFIISGSLDDTRYDLFNIKSLKEIPVWNDFLDELEKYDYTSTITEEFVFDLTYRLMLRTLKGKEEILRYVGTLSMELESPVKTIVRISMKSQKTKTEIPRDYLPKPLINRYSDLDF